MTLQSTTRATFARRLSAGTIALALALLLGTALTAAARAETAPAGILFKSDFENGFEGWHIQSLPERLSLVKAGVFQGTTAARFEVREGDVEPRTGSQRSELSGPTFNEGEDLYVNDAFRIPRSNTFSAPWQIVQQLHEVNWSGSPGLAVFLDSSNALKLGAGDSSLTFWKSPALERGRWYDLIYRVKLSQNSSVGFVEVWLNGVKQSLGNGGTRMYGQTTQAAQAYLKAGLYRSRYSTGTSVVEHDAIAVGTNLAAVKAIADGVFFRGDFENGFEGWSVQSLPERLSLVQGDAFQGAQAARFEVREGDVEPRTGSQRSELSGPTFNEREDLYINDAIRIPAENTFSTPWQIVQQLHEVNWSGSPGLAVFLDSSNALKLGAGDGSPTFWKSEPLQRGRWYDLTYRVKLSQNSSVGFVEVWLNGVRQRLANGYMRIYGQTMQAPQAYLKAGAYRSQYSTGTSIVEHDAIDVGSSLAAVTPKPEEATEGTEGTESTEGTKGIALFNGDFDGGFAGWYIQSLPERISLVSSGVSQGSQAARFEVREGDVEPQTGSQRSEVSGPTFNEGEDLYVNDAFRISGANTFSTPWQIIQQLHEENWGGSPGLAVFLDSSNTLKLGAGDGSPTYWHSQPLERKRWYDLTYRVKLSQSSSAGFVEVWLNGVQQTLGNGQTRAYGQTMQTSQTYLKAGIYRSKYSTGTSIVEHDAIVVGTSLAAAMAG